MAGRRLSSNDVSVVIALAIVVLILLLVYIAERGESRAAQAAAVDSVDAPAMAGNAVARPIPEAPERGEHRAATAEDCGIETAKAKQSESEADAVVERQRDEALQVILPALETRSDPRSRAAALYFRASRDLVDTVPADARERRSGDSESAEALARLAVDSSDPQVYAWAYRSCARVTREVAASCQMISALQWARLDPANAVPWLAVAREAKRKKDAAGLDDAMFHVATATIHDPGWGRAAAQMIEAAPVADRMSVGTWLAALSAIVYETIDHPSLPDVSTYCEARALGNASRRDTCDKIATLFLDRSTTRAGRIVGIELARKLGWPAARLAVPEQERDAAYAVDLREAHERSEPTTCDNVRRDLSRLVEVARVGEMEVSKRRIDATGESIDTLAAENRRYVQSLGEAEAAGAASSPGSASAAASPDFSAAPPAR